MITPTANPKNLEAAFRRCLERITTPHQSCGPLVGFPGSSIAAAEMGISRSHLHRVLKGERKSPSLMARWQTWLNRNPQFAALQPHR
jgi:hypothetical protein